MTSKFSKTPKSGDRPCVWKKTEGFTLIELLVVIAILGLLMSLVVPAAGRVGERGRAVSCMNNLRQTGFAILNYSADNNGQFPLHMSTATPPYYSDSNTDYLVFWTQVLVRNGYMGVPTNQDWRAYPRTFACPSLPNAVNRNTGGVDARFPSFAIPRLYATEPHLVAAGMPFIRGGSTGNMPLRARIAFTANPSRALFMVETANHLGQPVAYFRSGPNSNGEQHRPHLRHGGRANAWFADGHVSALDWKRLQALGFGWAWGPDMEDLR